jgi:hypothetical protein
MLILLPRYAIIVKEVPKLEINTEIHAHADLAVASQELENNLNTE